MKIETKEELLDKQSLMARTTKVRQVFIVDVDVNKQSLKEFIILKCRKYFIAYLDIFSSSFCKHLSKLFS